MATLTRKQLEQALELSKQIEMLDKKKSGLQAKLDGLLAGGSAKRKPGRPKKKVTRKPAAKKKAKAKSTTRSKRSGGSKQAVVDVLKAAGKPLGINEILAALTAKGHKSGAKNPKNALRVMLYGDKKTFKNTARGRFTL